MKLILIFFLFLLNNVFIADKTNTKRNKSGFILYALEFEFDSPPLNSLVKNKTRNFFPMLGLIASIKNIKQNIQENIVQ